MLKFEHGLIVSPRYWKYYFDCSLSNVSLPNKLLFFFFVFLLWKSYCQTLIELMSATITLLLLRLNIINIVTFLKQEMLTQSTELPCEICVVIYSWLRGDFCLSLIYVTCNYTTFLAITDQWLDTMQWYSNVSHSNNS